MLKGVNSKFQSIDTACVLLLYYTILIGVVK